MSAEAGTSHDPAVEYLSERESSVKPFFFRSPFERAPSFLGMDVQAMFRRLLDRTSSLSRSHEALRNLRKRLKRVGSAGLPNGDHCEYFEVLYELLGDSRWKVVCEATMLMVDIVPFLPDFELDHCLSLVLSRVIPNLGHFSTDVRRASLRLLHVYMKYTNNLQKVLRSYIQHGLVSGDKAAQKGSILSLPLLFTEEFANENLFILVQTLSDLLVTSDTALFYPVFLAMQRLQTLVGRETFRVYLNHVRPDAVMLFHRVISRSSTANSDENGESDQNPDFGTRVHGRHQVVTAEFICADSMDSSDILPSDLQPGLSFGIFPRLLIRRALSDKLPEKLDSLRQILLILNESSQAHLNHFANHLHEFIKSFAREQLESVNYKVTLYGLDILLVVVERLKMSVIASLRPLTSLLLKHLGDTRTAVREHNIRIIHRVMFSIPPQLVLDSLLEHKFHRNPRVREEILNRITAAILTFGREDLNLSHLCGQSACMLVDNKRIVRTAALEAVAVLAHALGPRNVDTIFSAVKETQDNSEAYGLIMAVQARLSRRELPRCSLDGIVRHVLNPMNFPSWLPNDSDADIEWVLLGSGTASNTPTKMLCHGHKSDTHPQVSFDVSSDSSVQPESMPSRRPSIRPQDSDTCDDCVSRAHVHRKRRSRTEKFQPRIYTSGSSSNGESIRSDDSRARDLWRYYLTVFKDSSPGIPLVSLPSDHNNGRGVNMNRPYSADSSTSGDSVIQRRKSNLLPVQQDIKFQRAVSMPIMSPGHLSDISERSCEHDTSRKAASRQSIAPLDTTSPDKSPRRVSIAVGALDRPSRLERLQTPNPKARNLLEVESPHDATNDQMGPISQQSSRPGSACSTATEATQIVNTREETTNQETTSSAKQLCHKNEQEVDNATTEREPGAEDSGVHVNVSAFEDVRHDTIMKDAQTQKDESDSSTEQVTVLASNDRSRSFRSDEEKMANRKIRYISKSKSPSRRNPYQTRVEPAIPPDIDVYGILGNVAQTEGSFLSPEDALKAAITAFTQDIWTTKVEGMLAISRLATFHPHILSKELHTVVLALVYEVRNLRSSVARSAIYTLGDLLVKMKKQIEPDIDVIGSALLAKCGENVLFIRDDIDRALTNLIEEMPQSKCVLTLVTGGAHHRNSNVRRTAAQYLATVVEKMGPNKCLLGPRDVAEHLLPAAAGFVQDSSSPLTRFYGRVIFSVLYLHPQFEKLMRRFLTPPVYRSVSGILESVKRRGVGEKPVDITRP